MGRGLRLRNHRVIHGTRRAVLGPKRWRSKQTSISPRAHDRRARLSSLPRSRNDVTIFSAPQKSLGARLSPNTSWTFPPRCAARTACPPPAALMSLPGSPTASSDPRFPLPPPPGGGGGGGGSINAKREQREREERQRNNAASSFKRRRKKKKPGAGAVEGDTADVL